MDGFRSKEDRVSFDPTFEVEALPELQAAPQRWLRVVDPVAGEALTSLLSRQARSWGINLKALLKDLDPSIHRSVPDLDLAPPDRLISLVSRRTDFPIKLVQSGTLHPLLHHLMPLEELAKVAGQRWNASHLAWILPAGWQVKQSGKVSPEGGIPYCPCCILEDDVSFSPLVNRLAFTVACPKHKVLLLDRCPTCQSLTSPALSGLRSVRDGALTGIRCESCQPDFPTLAPKFERADAGVLRLQTLILDGLKTGFVSIPQLGKYPTVSFLGGLRVTLTATSWLREQGISLPPKRNSKVFPPVVRGTGNHEVRFENASLPNRIARLTSAAWITEEPLDRWPLLQQLCAWPTSLPKSWRHPWEGVNDSGQVVKRDNWSNRQSRLDDGQDVQRTRAFFNLVEALDLHPIRVQGMLGNISSRRYLTWKNRPASRISLECARRMESFLRIWEGLLQLFQQEDAARAWLLQPKKVSPFDGRCPKIGRAHV